MAVVQTCEFDAEGAAGESYLAGVEMSDDLDDDLVVLVGGLLPRDHHLGGCQVLQLVHLQTHDQTA